MNKLSKHILLLSAVLILFSFYNCSEDSPTDSDDQPAKNYFPVNEGTFYKYELSESDSTGVLRTGNRNTIYNGTAVLNSITYSRQIDSVALGTDFTSTESYFRKTIAGVFYFVDTSEVILIVPDTLRPFVTLQTEFRYILIPLAEGSQWPVYRVSIRLQSGISFTALEVTGKYLQTENLQLNLVSGVVDVTAVKVQFDLSFITDVTQPERTLTAYAWFVENVGTVKMEGNSVVLGALLRGEINFEDSTKTITQEIVDYNIR
jgi:hypothetical protein